MADNWADYQERNNTYIYQYIIIDISISQAEAMMALVMIKASKPAVRAIFSGTMHANCDIL